MNKTWECSAATVRGFDLKPERGARGIPLGETEVEEQTVEIAKLSGASELRQSRRTEYTGKPGTGRFSDGERCSSRPDKGEIVGLNAVQTAK